MLNIVIPLAGSSDIFLTSGFQYPKPIIELLGTTMIEQVIKNPMRISVENKFIFIIKEEDALKYHLDNTLKLICPNAIILILKNETKGALCSLLMTIDIVAPNDELLILNGDQIIDVDFDLLIKKWINYSASVGIVTFPSVHPRWSYALIENGLVVQTAEKNPISNNAIAGYYYFRNAKDFFNYAYISIKNDEQILDAYYISPVINQYILDNHIVKDYLITSDKYHSFYSPQMLNEFERKYKSNESI
jgi:NDP-sugar pyrophosphorylase family protein